MKKAFSFHLISMAALALFFGSACPAFATTYTWVGLSGSNWQTTTDWSPNGTPGTGDTAEFTGTASGTVAVNYTGSVVANTFLFDAGSTRYQVGVASSQSYTITVNSAINQLSTTTRSDFYGKTILGGAITVNTADVFGFQSSVSGAYAITGTGGGQVIFGAANPSWSGGYNLDGSSSSSSELNSGASGSLGTGLITVNTGFLGFGASGIDTEVNNIQVNQSDESFNFTVPSQTVNLTGNITGSAGNSHLRFIPTKTGVTIVLSGSNTTSNSGANMQLYAGTLVGTSSYALWPTIIMGQAGTPGPVNLLLTNSASTATTISVDDASGATVSIGGGDASNVTYSGPVTLTHYASSPVSQTINLTATAGGQASFTGNISDVSTNTLSLVINASSISGTSTGLTGQTGKVVLSGSDSYKGSTSVLNGTLIVSGSLSGTSSTSVTNATLEGTGLIANGVTIGNGSGAAGSAILAPGIGATIGTLKTGALSLNNADAAFDFSIQTSGGLRNDEVQVTGALTLGAGVAEFNGTDLLSALLSGHTVVPLITTTGGITGYFANLAEGALYTLGSNSYTIYYGDYAGYTNDVVLVSVPEPGTWGMLAGGIGMLAVWRRARRTSITG